MKSVVQFISSRLSDGQRSHISSLIIRISLFSVTFSVIIMILTTLLIAGFKHELHQKLSNLYGDFMISPFSETQSDFAQNKSFEFSLDTLNLIQKSSNVETVEPFNLHFAMLKNQGTPVGLLLKCAKFDSISKENHFITEGRLPRLIADSSVFEIVISKNSARKLQAQLNDKLTVYLKSNLDNFIKVRKLVIVGIYNSSFHEHDEAMAWLDLSFTQKVMQLGSNEFHGINIYLKNNKESEKTAEYIWSKYLKNPLSIQTTTQRFHYLIEWINLQNINELLILIIMFFIALVNMISCILILILDRLKMIGVLKSIGAENAMIQNIFLNLSRKIILKGLLCGNIIALTLAFIQYNFKLITLPEKYYFISYVPIYFDWIKIIFLNVSFFILLVLALIIPTFIIRRLYPIQIMKYN